MTDQITTAAELDALPTESVIRRPGWVLSQLGGTIGGHRVWAATGNRREFTSEELAELGPFTLVYRPDAPAVLALLPQRVAPSEEILALWMHDNLGCSLDGCECVDKFEYYRAEAHSLAALYASQPTVAEVKAEAWDEGYTRGFYDRERLSPGIEGRDASEGATANPYRQEANHA